MFKRPSYHQLPDERLMELLQQGDERAFDELYRRYGERLHRYFYRMLWQETETANDFTQLLFMRLIERQEQYDSNRKFSTWLYTVANNLVKNEYRRRGRAVQLEELSEAIIPEEKSALDPLDRVRFNQQLESALDACGAEVKTCVLLRYRESWTIREISDLIGIPEGTVKSRIHYALKKLGKRLSQFNSVL